MDLKLACFVKARHEFVVKGFDYVRVLIAYMVKCLPGLDKLHNATARRRCRLRVDLWDFEDAHAYAEYR